MDQIKACIKKPLTGLKVAPYYGCQIVRPYATFDLMYYPVTMDKLLRAVGAEVVDYPLKTRCCGGSQKGTLPEVGLSLIHILLKEARRREAHIVSTICPLCQFNLDAFQDEASKKYGEISMRIVYFSPNFSAWHSVSPPRNWGWNQHRGRQTNVGKIRAGSGVAMD